MLFCFTIENVLKVTLYTIFKPELNVKEKIVFWKQTVLVEIYKNVFKLNFISCVTTPVLRGVTYQYFT